ncbi:MAG: hypothetical protein Q9210_002431 [Variospora velana]
MSDDVQIEAQFERDEIMAYDHPDPSPSPSEKQPQDQIPREQSQERLPIATTPDKSPEVASMINNMSLSRNRPLKKRKAPASADQEAQISRPGKIQMASQLQRGTVNFPPRIPQAPGGRLERPSNPVPGARPPVKTGSDPFNMEQAYPEDDQKDGYVDGREDRPEQFQSIAINESPSRNPAVILGALRSIPELVSTSTKGNTPGDEDKLDDEADRPINAADPPSSAPAAPRRSTRAPQKPINRSMPEGNQQSHGTEISKHPHIEAVSANPADQKKKLRGRPPKRPQPGAKHRNHGHRLRKPNVDDGPTPAIRKGKEIAATAIPTTKGQPPTPASSEDPEESGGTQVDSKEVGCKEGEDEEGEGEGAVSGTIIQQNDAEHAASTTSQAHQADEDDDTDVAEETGLELFGMDNAWRKIKVAIRNIRVSRDREDEKEGILKLATEAVKDLVEVIEKATQAYTSSTPDSSPGSAPSNDLSERQEQLVADIRGDTDELSEAHFPKKEGDAVQDIYVYAIPQMVALLEKALEARTAQLSERNNIGALQEIIRIQGLLADLCRKARDWSAKPTTKRPIMQPVRKIIPALKSLQGKFEVTLGERKRRLKQKENDAKRAKARRLEEESDRRSWEQIQQDKQARNQAIWNAISQKSVGPRPGMVVQLPQARSQEPERRKDQAQWTEEQDVQLFIEFFANGLEDLSGKDVYRAAGHFLC